MQHGARAMVNHPAHISLGQVTLVMKTGHRVRATVLHNNPLAQVLRVEMGDGFFAQVTYEDLGHAVVHHFANARAAARLAA